MNTFIIEYRNKISKFFENGVTPALDSMFRKILDEKPDTVRKELFKLEDFEYIKETLKEKAGILHVTEEFAKAFRNEIRHQYAKMHSNFLVPSGLSDEAMEAFEILKNNSDEIIAYTVAERCIEMLSYIKQDYSRLLYLLRSDEEKFYAGALLQLGFKTKELTALKSYHHEIADFIVALCEKTECDMQNKATNRQDSNIVPPIIKLEDAKSEKIKDKEEGKNFETIEGSEPQLAKELTEVEGKNKNKKEMTVKNMFENMELFQNLNNPQMPLSAAFTLLEKAGFDGHEVLNALYLKK